MYLLHGLGQGAKRSGIPNRGLPRIRALGPLTLIFLFAAARPTLAALPPGWTDANIGSPTYVGSASSVNGGWTVTGGGSDIFNSADQFNFASEIFNCDGSIVAKVTAVANSDPSSGWSKAGVMFRNDTTAGAVNALMAATAGQGVTFQSRNAAGGSSVSATIGGINPPVWVMLNRTSDQYSGFYSLDGSNWVQVGAAATLEMAGPALAGLAVSAHNNNALNTSAFTNVSASSSAFGVYREYWTNLSANVGNSLAALTNTADNPNWPSNPVASYTHVFTNFETEINTGVNYFGQRLRAYVVPPVSGLYSFWIASDDTSQLYLSTNENPAAMAPIASVASYTASEQWTAFASQQSSFVSLVAGCRYYLEARMQQGGGAENLSVRWQLPNGVLEQPMTAISPAGTLLIPCTGTNAPPGIYSQSSNITVLENYGANLSVLSTNQAAVGYQWYQNAGVKITGATLPVYTLANSLLANNGQVYTCVITNSIGSITSAPITLTILRDTNAPIVTGVFNIGLSNIEITFSKAIALTNATNLANYAFTNGLVIHGASLGSNNRTVTLANAPLAIGSNYSIVINNIYDRDSTPNVIAANTLAAFTAAPFAPQDVGSPAIPSTETYTSNGVNIAGAGYDIGGTSDQFNLQYTLQSGNFDVSVCLASLGLSDLWAEAGLMARASLDGGSPFASVLATPGMNGEFFSDRVATNGAAATAGSFSVNYPNTWLRLSRAGNVFTGFGSYDGTNWTALGSATISMPAQIYLGLALASHNTNQTAAADFVNYGTTPAGAVAASTTNPNEPLGPSSRKTGVVFSEIMWKPAPRSDGNNPEFLELYNSCPFFQDISGYQVTCADMNFTFPPNTLIPGGAFFVLAASPASIANVYGLASNVFGYTGSLKHSETLELLDEQSDVLLTVPYTDTYPWPVAASGTGHSMVLAHATYGEGDPRAWAISDTVGGSPGQMDAFTPSPLRSVVINEILPHTENPAVPQFIELYNHSANHVNIGGCILTDDPTTNKFVIPPGTTIGPDGYVSFAQSQFGFTLNALGETLYFIKPDGSRVLDAVQFGAQADGVAFGRWPDGANDFYALATNTPGTNNSPIVIGDIVINELMYDPISGDDDQYIELYNKGTNTVNLAGWEFTSGVTFTFPPNTIIASNGYVVVGKNTANLFAHYPNLNAGNTVGNYSGKLSHDGELVVLSQPESLYGTNTIFVEEDEVTYGTGGRWGQWSGGGGSSLELIDPRANHRLAANWADSDETQKSSWVDIENTGVLDNGSNYDASIDYAQIGLLDAGECLVDNIEFDFNNSNYVSNGTFEGALGLANWSMQGCMSRSSLENSGYQSGSSLHIRCSDKIFTGDNSCSVALNTNRLHAGQAATLRFKARWLHGWPEPLLRVNGNWLEATAAMPVPADLGSPGLPNSRYATNAGPGLYNVTHSPTVPAANQPVVVTAQAHDPDGVKSLTLYYRLDPFAAYTAVPMNDGGTNGDAIAHDGVFSATIPGQGANQIAAFYIAATDSLGASTRFPALLNNNSPVPECAVMFGDGNPGGSFGVYHLWITQTNVTRWGNLSDLSNEGNDCTFVNGTRVIYNMQGRFAGSPYHQQFDRPNGSLCHYKWEFNDDDKFLGATDFNKIHQPGNGPGDDASLQREELANSFLRSLGVPWLYKRLVAVYVNGSRRGTLMEDTQTPGGDVVKEHFPNDDGGFLFKMQPWFELQPLPTGPTMSFNNNAWCNLMPYTTTGGVKKTARYRYDFEIRRTPDSDNDFSDVFSLIDAANSYGTPNYVANMENIADMENWMRVFAANHAAGNWDSFGAENAQNLYGYIGTESVKYSLLMWDFNIVLGNSGSWGPGQNLFTVNGQDTNMPNIYNTPVFQRMYWRALQELVDGPLNTGNSGPLLMAKYNAFIDNGLAVENPAQSIEPWLSQAQTSIAAQLAAVNAPNFSIKSPFAISNNAAIISGQAPVNVDAVWINGIPYPLTWTTLTNWTITVPLAHGANILSVAGVDRSGNAVAGASNQLTVNYSGAVPSPAGQVAINEIMWNPPVTNAQYVELFNNSTSVDYDLSGWQLQGLSYTFPAGSVLAPRGFLVLAQNSAAFAAAYGATNRIFDTFSGALASGQLLSLTEPSGGSNVPVAQALFDDAAPWPSSTSGVSLQLVDSHQDNWREGNWRTGSPSFTPGASNSVAASLPPFPALWINEVEPDNLTGITNSAGQHAPWLELYNPGSNAVTLTNLYLTATYANLTNWAFPPGAVIAPGQFLVIFADGQTNLSTLSQLHTS
ncbi:MAG TPA: lamin tail domain-containing protein, partial [Verrucomicrobiae bacterium]